MSRALLGAAALALGGVIVLGPAAPAPAAPSGSACPGVNDVEAEADPVTEPSDPLRALRVTEAQDVVERLTRTEEAGTGVVVGVVDSGVSHPAIDLRGEPLQGGPLVFYHGTAMAGVIAGDPLGDGVGPVGIAPGAEVYDARFYDGVSKDDGDTPTEDNLVAGLRAMLPDVGRGPGEVSIVVVPVTVEESTPELESAVRAVTDAGAVLVASSGNREPETAPGDGLGEAEEDTDDAAYEPGEDVTRWPAGYSATNTRVVSVGTLTDPDAEDPATPAGLLSSSIDVVVPTYGAVSYAINGSSCSFDVSSTSVAAAEVAGVLALLRAAYPEDTPEQSIARLEVTATGGSQPGSGVVDTYRGRGVVQPVEALTRPLRPDNVGVLPPGAPPRTEVSPATLPPSQPDVLRSTRRDAVWWGLFGGGALVVALLLRPVLSRRRAR